jgi:glycosyltransferase involved in cell wall biosynthesis
MRQLTWQNGAKPALLAKIALCQGLLSQSAARMAEDCARLCEFINATSAPHFHSTRAEHSGKLSLHLAAEPLTERIVEGLRRFVRTSSDAQLRDSPHRSESDIRAAFVSIARQQRPRYKPKPGSVVMVVGNLVVGGSERQMVATVSGLIARRYEVGVLALEEAGPGLPSFESELRDMGVDVEFASRYAAEDRLMRPSRMRLPRPSAIPDWALEKIVAVGSYIERRRPAAIHCWLDHPSIYGGLAGCAMGVPRIVLQHGSTSSIFRRNVEWAGFWRQAYSALAGNVAVKWFNNSYAGACDYEQWIGLPRGSISTLYNGFIPAAVRKPSLEETAQLRAKLGLPADVVVVGTVMRFVPEKDPQLWLDTVSEVVKRRGDVHFLAFGYGPLQDEMIRGVDARGLGNAVTLAGPTSDAGLAYSVMDIVLLTSGVEGTPNVAIEAQAAGRPVVVPDVGGTAEAVLDGVTGIVARPRSPASLAQAIVDLIDDPARRRSARRDGPRFVADRFGLDRMVDEITGCYEIDASRTLSRPAAIW